MTRWTREEAEKRKEQEEEFGRKVEESVAHDDEEDRYESFLAGVLQEATELPDAQRGAASKAFGIAAGEEEEKRGLFARVANLSYYLYCDAKEDCDEKTESGVTKKHASAEELGLRLAELRQLKADLQEALLTGQAPLAEKMRSEQKIKRSEYIGLGGTSRVLCPPSWTPMFPYAMSRDGSKVAAKLQKAFPSVQTVQARYTMDGMRCKGGTRSGRMLARKGGEGTVGEVKAPLPFFEPMRELQLTASDDNGAVGVIMNRTGLDMMQAVMETYKEHLKGVDSGKLPRPLPCRLCSYYTTLGAKASVNAHASWLEQALVQNAPAFVRGLRRCRGECCGSRELDLGVGLFFKSAM